MISLIIFFLFIISFTELHVRDWKLVHPRYDLESIVTINCYDSINCFAFSDFTPNAILYKTKDKGGTWYKIYEKVWQGTHTDSVFNLTGGYSLDSNYLYYFYLDRAILEKSTNGGYSFERVSFGSLSTSDYNAIYDMTMYNNNLGVALTKHELLITFDNWKSNKIVPISYTNYPGYNLFFIDSNNIGLIKYFKYNDDIIKYNISDDTWEDFYLGEEEKEGEKAKAIYTTFFVNDSLGYACGMKDTINENFEKNIIWKTTNRGKDWNIVFNDLHDPKTGLMQLSFKDENHGIAVGPWGAIVETVDGGKSWTYIEPPIELRGPALKVEWAGEYALFASCCSGIYRLDPWVKSIEKDIINQEKIKIRQSKDKLLISINDKKYRKHKIEIFDLQGLKLNEQSLSSGGGTLFQPVRIDHYPSGAYFYRISVGSELVYSGKFIR